MSDWLTFTGIIAEGTLMLWPIVLAAAVPMVVIRPAGRLVFFLLGLAFFLLVAFGPIGSPGLHGEGFVISFGLAICAGAILADAASRAIGIVRKMLRARRDAGQYAS